jgi:putative peptidoglycan lipid II flippase
MFARNFFTVSFFVSISRILGFVRDILIARFVGIGLLSDVFFAAFRVPNFFRRVFAEGAFNNAFVPIFIDKCQDQIRAKQFLGNIISWLSVVLLLIIICFQLFMPFLMQIFFPGFFAVAEKGDLLINLSRITIFYLFFIVIFALFASVLNSLDKFAIPAASQLILNLTLIIFMVFFANIFSNYAYCLSWAVFVAGLLQLLCIGFFSYRRGFLVLPKLPQINSDLKLFFRKFLPGIIGANVLQINLLVDSIFASAIAGAVSYLYYADRINQLPLALIGIAIGIALLPSLARKIKENDLQGATKLQNTAIEVAMLLAIPASLALTILAEPIIAVLFERGAFGGNETIQVAKALRYYSIGLPAYILVKIFEPTFFARSNTKTPMFIAIGCVVVNIAFNYIFAYLNFGFVGIILASIIASYLNFICLLLLAIHKQYFRFATNFWRDIFKIMLCALLMAGCLLLLCFYWQQHWQIWQLFLAIFCGIAVYAFSAYFAGYAKLLKKIKR